MAITPADIQAQTFSEAKRGYDPAEVDVFLETLSSEVDAMLAKIVDLKGRLTATEQQLADAAKVETVTDSNGLQAIRVTFEGGILFPTNGTTLSASSKADLSKFAASLLQNPLTDVRIYGFTDDTGTLAVNQRVSTGRAEAVRNYLLNSGVASSRLYAEGLPMTDYVASNATAEGRAQNRRVEIYILANQQMVQQAEQGTLK